MQHYAEHGVPHFHAVQGGNRVSIEIALPLRVIKGSLQGSALVDVIGWAKTHRAALALNWVDAIAQAPLAKISYP